MKRIMIFNTVAIFLIIIISYISTPDNQILSNHHLLIGFMSVIGFMTLLWILSLIVKDASIVDIFWGPAFIVLSSSLLVSMNQVYSERSLFILFLVSETKYTSSPSKIFCFFSHFEFKKLSNKLYKFRNNKKPEKFLSEYILKMINDNQKVVSTTC